MLALFVRATARTLADAGFVVLNIMLAIYIGARLVTGSFADVMIEVALASAVTVIVRLAMTRWMPAIGAAIFLHGMYDAFVGPHTGVAGWYPPLCAGFDWVVGIALIVILIRKIGRENAA